MNPANRTLRVAKIVDHGLFLAAAVLVVVPAALVLDPVAGNMHSEWPRPLWLVAEFTTHFGEAHWIMVPTGLIVVAAWLRHVFERRTGSWNPSSLVRICSFLFAVAAAAQLVSTAVKVLVGRARPQLMDAVGAFAWKPHSVDASYLSFPSGHATTVGAVCMAVAILWPSMRLLALAVALWLGLTRVFVGAHYPSDVMVGLVLGACLTMALAALFERKGVLSFPFAGDRRLAQP